jgi:cytochrome c oxidase subunit I
MSSIATPISSPGPGPAPQRVAPAHHYLNHSSGIMSWLLTLDHKRIGLMYLIGVLGAFAVGGIFAVLLRTELLTPGPTFASDPVTAWKFYNHMFTLHGALMVFVFIIPSIPAILGNFVLPLQLGAKDVAFPRLNLLSFYCWVVGTLFLLYVLFGGLLEVFSGGKIVFPGGYGLDTGWTFYTPYSSTSSKSGVVPATIAVFILGFSSILTGLNFIASVHMLRPRGMNWFRMPLFIWAIYATALIQVLATPVLAITVILLAAERVLRIGIFDPGLGGDPVLYQHFFWFYSHPAVYIMLLPGMGIISELMATFSRRHIFGYQFIAVSSVAIALLGFLVWGHHMFTSGQSALANSIFSLITFSVAIPSSVKVFNWMATLKGGSIQLRTPMVYALMYLGLFVIGGLTGIPLGTIPVDIHFHDTYFVVAHFHYVMVGSTLFAFLGGMYYWWPKMFGKMYSEFWGIVGAIIAYAGFNLTFFIQFIAGGQGMPRRYASYPAEFQWYHVISTLGAYVLAVGLLIVLANWIHSLLHGKLAPGNPWGSHTLEWHTTSPPPHDNFPVQPVVGDPYDMHYWKKAENPDDGYILDPDAVEPVSAGHGTGAKH